MIYIQRKRVQNWPEMENIIWTVEMWWCKEIIVTYTLKVHSKYAIKYTLKNERKKRKELDHFSMWCMMVDNWRGWICDYFIWYFQELRYAWFLWQGSMISLDAIVFHGNVFLAKGPVSVSIHWCKSVLGFFNSSFAWTEMLEVRKWGPEDKLWRCRDSR